MADSPHIIDVTQDNYAELMEASFEVPVLIDFWAGWCQPCKLLMPVLAKLADEYQGSFLLGKLNTEEQQEIAGRFGVRSIPTVKLFRNAEPVDEFIGALPERAVREFLDRHVARRSDARVAEAREQLAAGDAGGAIALLTEARDADPDNPRVTLALAEAYAAAGDLGAAEAALDSLPAPEQARPAVTALRNRLSFAGQAAGAPGAPELEARLAAVPGDSEARYQLALRRVLEQDYAAAMELLLELMQQDRRFGDDAGRRTLLKVFELLGNDPLVRPFRTRMARLLH